MIGLYLFRHKHDELRKLCAAADIHYPTTRSKAQIADILLESARKHVDTIVGRDCAAAVRSFNAKFGVLGRVILASEYEHVDTTLDVPWCKSPVSVRELFAVADRLVRKEMIHALMRLAQNKDEEEEVSRMVKTKETMVIALVGRLEQMLSSYGEDPDPVLRAWFQTLRVTCPDTLTRREMLLLILDYFWPTDV